ncbi:hypothetical protein ACU4GR_14290 [Methylobacterium oryzae CBMB20]
MIGPVTGTLPFVSDITRRIGTRVAARTAPVAGSKSWTVVS